MRPLRDQMIEDLRLRGRAQNTIDTYVRCVRMLVDWAGVPPARLTAEQLRGFLLYLMDERHLGCASHDVYVGAIRFFFRVTMKRPDVVIDIPRRKIPMRLPTVPSQGEVAALIDNASILKHRAMFETLYGAGLRVSELRKLRILDIDSRSMVMQCARPSAVLLDLTGLR
jgi:site-specific recombinase XerD